VRINRFSDPRRPLPTQEIKARFIQPMLLQQVHSLPEGPNWAYEVKLDGYRALAIKCLSSHSSMLTLESPFQPEFPF